MDARAELRLCESNGIHFQGGGARERPLGAAVLPSVRSFGRVVIAHPRRNANVTFMQTLRRVPLGPGRFNTVLIVAAGSILDYTGDAFVNAANEGCTGGFGVDEQVTQPPDADQGGKR